MDITRHWVSSFVFMVDLETDTPTSWRVFFTWVNVVQGFFFTTERILQSFTTVVFCGRPGLFWVPKLSECTKLLIWSLLNFCYLSDGFFFFNPQDVPFHLHWELLCPHVVCSQQLPNANTTPAINSKPFNCLIKERITRDEPIQPCCFFFFGFFCRLLSQIFNYFWPHKRGGFLITSRNC